MTATVNEIPLNAEESEVSAQILNQEGTPPVHPAGNPITLKVRDQTGDEIHYQVRMGTPMSKIFQAYARGGSNPLLSRYLEWIAVYEGLFPDFKPELGALYEGLLPDVDETQILN
eukprot:gene22515-28644_t